MAQLFNLSINLKQYVFAKLFPKKLIVLLESNPTTTLYITIDPHMVVTLVDVREYLVEDVLLDGWSMFNIIINDLLKKLGLPTPRLTLYTLQMVDQTITKPIGLIKDLKIHIHGIPYIVIVFYYG
jgi:hypothetical protein